MKGVRSLGTTPATGWGRAAPAVRVVAARGRLPAAHFRSRFACGGSARGDLLDQRGVRRSRRWRCPCRLNGCALPPGRARRT